MTEVPRAVALLLICMVYSLIKAIKRFRHSEDDETQSNV